MLKSVAVYSLIFEEEFVGITYSDLKKFWDKEHVFMKGLLLLDESLWKELPAVGNLFTSPPRNELAWMIGSDEKLLHVGAVWEISDHFGMRVPEAKVKDIIRRCKFQSWKDGISLRRIYTEEELERSITYRKWVVDFMTQSEKIHMEKAMMSSSDPENYLPLKAMWGIQQVELDLNREKLKGLQDVRC